jgi:hypothetical protein
MSDSSVHIVAHTPLIGLNAPSLEWFPHHDPQKLTTELAKHPRISVWRGSTLSEPSAASPQAQGAHDIAFIRLISPEGERIRYSAPAHRLKERPMRTLALMLIAPLLGGCGTEGATDANGASDLATRQANTPDSEEDDANGGNEATDDGDALSGSGQSDATAADDAAPPEPIPCELSPGMCPNACEHGDIAQGDICVTDMDCDCGHCCGFGACQPFDAMGCESFADYATCLCQGETPGSDPVDPGNDVPWRVDAVNYTDECSSPTPPGSDCNPYCQQGCPAGSHCALVEDERFTCVTSGQGALGDACANSSECDLWMSCFGTFDSEVDTCRRVCDADEECPSGEACNLDIQISSSFALTFCDIAEFTCNIWMPDCPQDMKCVAVGGKTICTESTWDGIKGYPCTELGDCIAVDDEGQRLLCMSVDGCSPICSTADTVPLGAVSCGEMCPGGYTTVYANLQLGRCSTTGP